MEQGTKDNKGQPLILLEHVSKTYYIYKSNRQCFSRELLGRNTGDEHTVLKDINLEIQAGERIALLGTVGSGRSTLINLLAGITSPTKGTVTVRKTTGLIRNLRVGFLKELSGRKNIILQGAVFGWSKKECREREQEIIDFAQVSEIIDHPLNTYTSTDMNRLGFAIQTTMKPDIILFDAPFTKGDPAFRAKSIQRIQEMCEAGSGTLVMVTNDAKLAKTLCSRAILLENKRIALDGSVEEVFTFYKKKRKERIKKFKETEFMREMTKEDPNEMDIDEFG